MMMITTILIIIIIIILILITITIIIMIIIIIIIIIIVIIIYHEIITLLQKLGLLPRIGTMHPIRGCGPLYRQWSQREICASKRTTNLFYYVCMPLRLSRTFPYKGGLK